MQKRAKWFIILLLAVGAVACGNQPDKRMTPDGFDPPYNYY